MSMRNCSGAIQVPSEKNPATLDWKMCPKQGVRYFTRRNHGKGNWYCMVCYGLAVERDRAPKEQA